MRTVDADKLMERAKMHSIMVSTTLGHFDHGMTLGMLNEIVKECETSAPVGDMVSRQMVLNLLSTMPPEDATTKALLIQSVKQMSAVQPDEEKISDLLYDVYRLTCPQLGTGGVAVLKSYISMVYREIFGEEGPIWLKK